MFYELVYYFRHPNIVKQLYMLSKDDVSHQLDKLPFIGFLEDKNQILIHIFAKNFMNENTITLITILFFF